MNVLFFFASLSVVLLLRDFPKKSIFSEPKWGAQAAVKGARTLPCLTFSNKSDSVRSLLYIVDRWARGSLTQRLQGPFAVSRPRQLGKDVITIIITRVGLNLNFESTHELLMKLNLNSTFAKSMNLNVLIKHSMNLIFSNQNLHSESNDL